MFSVSYTDAWLLASLMVEMSCVCDVRLLAVKYLPWPLAPPPDGYTFFSVSQERVMDELDEEAKHARLQGPKTGANWDVFPARRWTVCLSCTKLRRDLCGHWFKFHETALDFILSWLWMVIVWFCCWLKTRRVFILIITLHATQKDPTVEQLQPLPDQLPALIMWCAYNMKGIS